jgi:hypothetical protein
MMRWLIMWMLRRCRGRWGGWGGWQHMTQWHPQTVNSGSTSSRLAAERLGIRKVVARRYFPFFSDEIQRGKNHNNTVHLKLPWYAPFNAVLHGWVRHDDEDRMHDHPRRSATIVLRGQIVEKTPWGERVLRPGSIVLRGPKFIHGFRVDPQHSARTWTLFIVGRRRFCQNTYVVTRRTEAANRGVQQ